MDSEAFPLRIVNPAYPQPTAEPKVQIRALTSALTSAWVASSIKPIVGARRVLLWIAYDAVTSASGAYPEIRPLVAGCETQPAIGDDEWFPPCHVDDTTAAAVTTGAAEPSGFDQTVTPEWKIIIPRGEIIRLDPIDAATDKIRRIVPFDVTGTRYFTTIQRELGDTTHPGKLGLWITRCG